MTQRNKLALASLCFAMFAGGAVLTAQDDARKPEAAPPEGIPQLPEATQEHAWLHQLVGEWETEGEVTPGPGQPPIKCTGKETVRPLGKFWTMAESTNHIMGMDMSGVLTLGYDPEKKKYVGTWVDSMTSYLWRYEGTVDKAGKVLTLDTEGPNPGTGELAKFREMLEITDKDHRTFSSAMEVDGKWITFVTIKSTRKK